MTGRMRVTEDHVRHLAELAGIGIAPGHMPGVIANLETLWAQAELLVAKPLDPLIEPAPVYRP